MAPPGGRQFEKLEATSLFCEQCKQAQPVIRKLLLVLPAGDKYAYYCRVCGHQVGSKIETGDQPVLWRPM
jgi:hypothetical protein